jgi:Tol biopolymer transport system component
MNRDIDRLDPAFDPRIADWLEADPDRAPRETLDMVFAALPSIPQRRVLRVPWRFMDMFTPKRAAIAAALGVLLISGAILVYQRPGTSNVGVSDPSPSATASESPAPGSPLGLAIVSLDGSVRQDLGLPLDAWMADLSADGSKIAFTTTDKGFAVCGQCFGSEYPAVVATGASVGNFLYADEAAGPRRLGQPRWSPDGSKLVFTGEDGSGNVDIYVADIPAAGRSMPVTITLRRLTTDPALDEFPAWSPDGSTILYDNEGATPLDDSGLSPTQEIWSVPAHGGTPVRLTENDLPDSQPDVARDGRVVFRRDNEIFTMRIDGTEQLRVETAASGFAPRWSPDGTRLALLRYDPSGRAAMPTELGRGTDLPLLHVVVVDVTTGDVSFVGPRVATDLNPVSWTPDGGALLVNRYDDGG